MSRPHATTFDGACALIGAALGGTARQAIVADASRSKDLGTALLRLRGCMRANVWLAGSGRIDLSALVDVYDRRTRQDGFHALHDWDGKADKVNDETIPVDVLYYLVDQRGAERADKTVLAILVDYYFMYVLALLSLRIWDEGDADDHLDALNRLLRDLQGPHGSGQPFADDGETLMLVATSHYERADQAYDTLLEKARGLNRSHLAKLALVHAASMGSHLRFGFAVTYGRDTVLMRDDNGVDYRWLCFALATLMKEYARLRDQGSREAERDAIAEAILNGLSPDARAFVGKPPGSLSACETERAGFHELFHRYKPDLLREFERHRASDASYSPLSFFYNFAHNVLKGIVVDALLRARPWNLTLNDLLTGISRRNRDASAKESLANTLMGYARSSPDMIRGRLEPVIVYDPRLGRQAYALTLRKINE